MGSFSLPASTQNLLNLTGGNAAYGSSNVGSSPTEGTSAGMDRTTSVLGTSTSNSPVYGPTQPTPTYGPAAPTNTGGGKNVATTNNNTNNSNNGTQVNNVADGSMRLEKSAVYARSVARRW